MRSGPALFSLCPESSIPQGWEAGGTCMTVGCEITTMITLSIGEKFGWLKCYQHYRCNNI